MLKVTRNNSNNSFFSNKDDWEKDFFLVKQKYNNSPIEKTTFEKILWDKILVDLRQIISIYKNISKQKEFVKTAIQALEQLQCYIKTELRRWEFWIQHNIPVYHGLRNTLEQEYIRTEREKIKVQENAIRNINEMEKELRRLWKEVLTCTNSLKLFE
ncbi:hypothetical protein ACFL5K_05615 [Gemmatimonadota bacterium]